MVDKIDFETERRTAELIGAFSKSAASYFSPVMPQPSADTLSKAASSISSTTGRQRSIPVLDMPKDAGPDVVDIGLDRMRALVVPEESAIDDLVQALFVVTQETSSAYLAAKREFFNAERSYSDAKEKERTQEMQKQIALSKKVGTWEAVEKSLISFGLIAAGVAGISMGVVPLGIAAVAVGTLMVVDQLLDDKAKKVVASWMARGDKESQELWVDRINLCCAATSLALSLGLAAPVAAAYGMTVATKYGAQLALTVAKAGAGGTKSVYEWMNNNQKALMMELDAACALAQKSVNRLIFEIQETCNTLYQLYENMHRIESNRDKLSRQMLRLHGR